MEKTIISHSVEDTEAAGAWLARTLLDDCGGNLRFICLTGDLGAGKTAFTRGFASVVSPGSRVKSPSYTIVNEYRKGAVPLFHFDLYRLGDDPELDSVGFDEYLQSGHIIMEWSEYLPQTPDGAVTVDIRKTGDNDRSIHIKY